VNPNPNNRPFDRLLAVFAHPDDEAFSSGGVLAAAHDRGVEITLVCATRGEAGEILVPELATPENLGEVREGELRRAMDAVGIADVRFLDYRDSGMIGTSENEDPRALMQAPTAEVVDRVARVIRELHPAVVLTFGPDGFYGHPDHLAVSRATTDAVLAVGEEADGRRVRALYYTTMPRERFREIAERPNSRWSDITPEQLATMGTPLAEITTIVDVGPFVERKRAAMAAHRTQFGDSGPLHELPRDEVDLWLGREHFVRAALPWDDPAAPFDPFPLLSSVPETFRPAELVEESLSD
jgi:N-acetyl-1-D-myo-inositol-2-amino-2-deoxy-alpha-D-glucopyranoside deacetylase